MMDQNGKAFDSVEALHRWCSDALPGTTVPAAQVALALADLVVDRPESGAVVAPEDATWQERLWTVPGERRLNIAEAVEALGRSKTWIRERLKGPGAIPHRKLEGALVFKAGELRAWIEDHEHVEVGGRST